ncbi:MAG TPA: hypothetical protein VFV72_02205 [Candidatus Limnocylindrales bacterium]|nr:hypothetical protein [Candidatus Limnocylindrales bacterium]
MSRPAGRALLAAAWLIIVIVLSLGAAGIVATMAHNPETGSRAELTYTGDKAFEPGLSAAEAELSELSGEVGALSQLGRKALTLLTSDDSDALDATVADGQALASTITTHGAEIRTSLEALPGLGPAADLTLSPEMRRRHAIALGALDSIAGLEPAWSQLAVSSAAASRIVNLLTTHDATTGEAAAAGRAENYTDALAKLDESDSLMSQARALRDTLSRTVDVATLTDWLDLNSTYDAALRRLYQSLVDSGGRVNDEVRAAFEAEKEAASHLPPDSKALVVILAEIGRGGLNQAVIEIEQTRGELDSAIGLLGPVASEQP